MFCLLKIVSSNGNKVWEEELPNNPLTHRALAITVGKESDETLRPLEIYNQDIEFLKSPFTVCLNDEQFEFTVLVKSGMWDRKAANIMLGDKGAYCDLCTSPKEYDHDVDQV